MRQLTLRVVEFLAPTHLAEALVGDFEEAGAGALEIARSIPHLIRPRMGRAAMAAAAAWIPLVAMEALARFVRSQVPLKTGPDIPWVYLATGIVLSCLLSLVVLKKEENNR
ncbi:MAG: hypothetical protein SFV18_20735 [Bryobacteraceae bacterium]|nr:hypothetical protein [Bryobacteraceae bacterium]